VLKMVSHCAITVQW